MRHYDCAVVGSGPAGQRAAIQAAKLGKSVCVIEKSKFVGGVMVNTGTIPSKALREAVMHLTGHHKQGLYGRNHRVKRDITINDLASMSSNVIRNEWNVIQDAFDRNDVDLIWGRARFEGPNLVVIENENGNEMITADTFILGVGTKPAKPASIPFDDEFVMCSDGLLKLDGIPKSMIVVGGGVIGTEYACIMATLGVRVTLVEGRNQLLGFLDSEIAESLQYHMRKTGVTLRMNEKVDKIEKITSERDGHTLVQATLESGKHINAECLLYAVGRQGVCGELGLDNVGVSFDDRERLKVNENYQTNVDHIYAVGDVIGFPALASTSMEQGRIAVCHAYGQPIHSIPELFPYGVYAVPELSMVGKTEQQLTKEGIPYEAGIAHYSEVARGQLLGDEIGMLKLLIHQETRKIVGVHCIGTGATELVHIGQAVMALGGTVDYFVHNVFNYPTLAEAYKIAALNGSNKLANV
ncbi:MAG TPA: Si-specific NAD(P)(+) transhydrogenase [Phycisphaerales bacterium]|nr:Si-specific NAD(P)(+) transhydrogenase [Phycisphaerales bacterium]HCD33144.1 Si-specific NAD(P)(+) transhydrogenase [Phycisphaerales bacterium]